MHRLVSAGFGSASSTIRGTPSSTSASLTILSSGTSSIAYHGTSIPVSTSSMAIVPSTSRSAEDPISASEIQRTPYDRSDRNLDTIPPHQLQPCLKSICEELKRLRHIVEVLQAEQKKMAGSVTKFLNLPFPLKLVPLKLVNGCVLMFVMHICVLSCKEELCVQLAGVVLQ